MTSLILFQEPELHFSDPMQLLDIFAELEEHNLSLIQYSQDTEETLDEMKKTIVKTKEKMYEEHSSNVYVSVAPTL